MLPVVCSGCSAQGATRFLSGWGIGQLGEPVVCSAETCCTAVAMERHTGSDRSQLLRYYGGSLFGNSAVL